MYITDNETALSLMKSFRQFHKVDWHAKSIAGHKPSEIRVLFCLEHKNSSADSDMTVSEISKLLHVTSPTITQLINGLEANGLVERSIDKTDRRSVRVKLTEQGERVTKKAAAEFSTSLNGLIEYLGESDSNRLAELLDKVFFYFNQNSTSEL